MKKYLLFIAVCACARSLAVAQDDSRRWQFGLMAGPQFGRSLPKQSDEKGSMGVLAGADVGYRLQSSRKGWSVHLQPNYTAFSRKQEDGVENSDYYFKFKGKSNSLHVPLLIRYTFLNGKWRPFADLGMNWVVRTSSSYQSSGRLCTDGAGCISLDGEQRTGNADVPRLGALASAGVQVDLGKVIIPITVRVVQDVKKKEVRIDGFDGKYAFPKTRMIQLTAGVTF